MIAAFLSFSLFASSSALTLIASDDRRPLETVVADAERAFAEGVNARNDAEAARRYFGDAARGYDELWRRGCRNAALALNRSRAHRLAGDLAAAIAALHEGLFIARYDRRLEVELEDARSAVAYSHDDLAALCRPKPAGGIGSRMSPLEAYLAAGLLWLVTCLGIARFAMTRVPGWLLISAMAAGCLLVLGGLWWQDWRNQSKEQGRPLVIVNPDAALKAGNGETWPDRLKWRLPRGAEARELTRRGGWIQVQLAGGPVGWLPGSSAISVAVE
jgi:hypothetical protein